MGNRCVKPRTTSSSGRRTHHRKKHKKKLKIFYKSSSPKFQVLENPTGRNILEKYDLAQELGRGEFGVTCLCTESRTGDQFACKSISKKKLRMAVDVEDVRREVVIMRHLPRHPNLVSLRDVYEDDNAVHLVMELCEGGELFDRIVARGHYTERAAANVMRTIVEVVQVRVINWIDNLS